MLLPQIRPIAEGDEELTLLSGLAGLITLGADGADVPPAICELERRLVLTMLVMQWSEAMRRSRRGSTAWRRWRPRAQHRRPRPRPSPPSWAA